MMTGVVSAMEDLAAAIAARVDRPVTADSRNVGPLPSVVVEPPSLTADGSTLCGETLATFPVYVVAPPGGLAELRALDTLLGQVIDALDAEGASWTTATPLGYVPLNFQGAADPCQAYRIDVERLI